MTADRVTTMIKPVRLVLPALLAAAGLLASACGAGPAAGDGDQPECQWDSDCSLGLVCQAGSCRTPDGDGEEEPEADRETPPDGDLGACHSDSDCPLGTTCQNGECRPPGDGDGDDREASDLNDDADRADPDPPSDGDAAVSKGFCEPCATDPECGGPPNRCLPDSSGNSFCAIDCSGGVGCPTNIDAFCKRFADRVTFQCVPSSGYCTTADRCRGVTCGPRMACDPQSGQCMPGIDHCGQTGCPDGQQCNYQTGVCEAGYDGCQDDNDCPWGYSCNWMTHDCEPTGCQANGCPAGQECDYVTGLCQPEGCFTAGCPAGFHCDYATDECVSDSQGGYCAPCADWTDCDFRFTCIRVPGMGGSFCAPDCFMDPSDCPAGAICRSVEDEFGFAWEYCVPASLTCGGRSGGRPAPDT